MTAVILSASNVTVASNNTYTTIIKYALLEPVHLQWSNAIDVLQKQPFYIVLLSYVFLDSQ